MNPDILGSILGGDRAFGLSNREMASLMEKLAQTQKMLKDTDLLDPIPEVEEESEIIWTDIGDDVEDLHGYELEIDRMSPKELIRAWRAAALMSKDAARSEYLLNAVMTLAQDYPAEYEAASKAIGYNSDSLLKTREV